MERAVRYARVRLLERFNWRRTPSRSCAPAAARLPRWPLMRQTPQRNGFAPSASWAL